VNQLFANYSYYVVSWAGLNAGTCWRSQGAADRVDMSTSRMISMMPDCSDLKQRTWYTKYLRIIKIPLRGMIACLCSAPHKGGAAEIGVLALVIHAFTGLTPAVYM
jgi:hypothetical protein